MVTSHDSIAAALRGAHDVRGVGRLLACLGYELVAPPDGVPLDGGSDSDAADGVARRLVAAGDGLQVIAAVDGCAATGATRATRLRALLGDGARPLLLLWPADGLLTVATGGLDGRPRALSVSTVAPRGADIEAMAELRARDDGVLAALARHARALDRSTLTRRFFRDFRAQRDAVSRAWLGLPATAARDRNQLALLFLSRLVFLYFLQKQEHLGSEAYLVDLLRHGVAESGEVSFFRRALIPLFFGVLNTPPAARSSEARALGELPYLNGGLFERHALELAHPSLDLPDPVVIGVFESLLERYRFTARETESRDDTDPTGIQPEMLGRMFEELMATEQRTSTGTFYTPAAVVDRIVRRALQGYLAGQPGMDWRAAGLLLKESSPRYGAAGHGRDRRRDSELLAAVRGIRVLDPACGSGAFVLGSLERLTNLRRALGEDRADADIRRDLASDALHGVDVEPDAALLCALRLWLALTPGPAHRSGPVRPLPNLDQRVRQGDALIDPMDLAARGDAATAAWRAAALDTGVRRARRVLSALVRRYASATTHERADLRRRLARCEMRLARRWIDGAVHRLDEQRGALRARARGRDLFGERHADRRRLAGEIRRNRDARAELRRLDRRLRNEATLPFFSFAVHFAAAGAGCPDKGFDLIVSNPPWVRSHRWPRAFATMIRARYLVCGAAPRREAGRGSRVGAGGQVDLALLFVERGLELLGPGGVLALLLPSKAFRSLSAGAARKLVTERAGLLAIEDHALDHRAIFRADAFAGVLVARKADDPQAAGPNGGNEAVVRVRMTHRCSPRLRFEARCEDLMLDRADPRSPWLLVPPDVRRAIRTMQANGRTVSSDPELVPRRGAMTGANEALLFGRAERKLGDAVVAWPSARRPGASAAQEARSVLLHTSDLCPVVRGCGIRPFRYTTEQWVAWCHDDESAAPRPPSNRLARVLAGRQKRLRARTGWRPGLPDGVLFRVDAAMLKPRVAWRDIATDLEVVRLPARARSLGEERPLIALNTVYFFPVVDEQVALALSALLAALPSRVFARSIAERAKDARFRFFAWTVGAIPLPHCWRDDAHQRRLADLGERAHATGTAPDPSSPVRAEIDDLVRELLELSASEVSTLRRFDRWLSGNSDQPRNREVSA